MKNLEGAYALKTPEDSKRLYADWASTYDATFAEAYQYVSPQAVASAFVSAGGTGRVLDVGAGTGLVGEALAALKVDHVDGTDIAPEMLAEAALKDIYDRLFEGDVLATLDAEDETYDGIVSAGTFTHGHVGPDALDELLRVAKSGAWLVLSVHTEHFTAQGFDTKLTALTNQISNLSTAEFRLYAAGSKGSHADDLGLMVQFQKT